MSVKCEQPLDELTVQVWLLYGHPNFKYCTLFISGTELRTDKRTDGQMIQTLDAPGGPFRPGGIKTFYVSTKQPSTLRSEILVIKQNTQFNFIHMCIMATNLVA